MNVPWPYVRAVPPPSLTNNEASTDSQWSPNHIRFITMALSLASEIASAAAYTYEEDDGGRRENAPTEQYFFSLSLFQGSREADWQIGRESIPSSADCTLLRRIGFEVVLSTMAAAVAARDRNS